MTEATEFDLLVGTFDEETAAHDAVERLLATFKSRRAEIPALASVVKQADGKLVIQETDDVGKRTGAIAGGLAGGLLGLFGGKKRAVVGAGLGALLGGLAADRLDTGIPDPRLQAIGNSLEAASSAVVGIIAASALGEAKATIGGLGGSVVTEPFDRDTDFVKQLQAGDYEGALSSLATHAESYVAKASDKAGNAAQDLTGKAGDLLDRDSKTSST